MSFGYGVGDFLAIAKLASKVYNVYKDAPDDFKNISDEIDSLHIIVSQQDRTFKDRKLCSKQTQELGRILYGCENVLKDLDKLMSKYQGLGSPLGPKTIDRLKWDPDDVVLLRGRLTSNITLLNAFLASCQHEENQRSMAAIQELLKHAAIPRRNSITSIRSFASFATTRSAKAAWKDFCRDLHRAGVTIDALRTRKDEIVRTVAESSNAPALQGIVDASVASNIESIRGDFTTQHSSATTPGLDRIPRLLDKKPNIDAIIRDEGAKLLHGAATHGDLELARQLLDKGADVDAIESQAGSTALHWAASNGQSQMVEFLLNKGANIDIIHRDLGMTAFHLAAINSQSQVVELLVNKGADIDAKGHKVGFTALQWAVFNDNFQMVELLLDKGANIDAIESSLEITALQWAARQGHSQMVELLLDKGANMNVRSSPAGSTALHFAIHQGHSQVVELLLDKGAGIDTVKGLDESTPLHIAADNGYPEIISVLLKNGANVGARDKNGKTPLDRALAASEARAESESHESREKRTEIIKLLRAHVTSTEFKPDPPNL